MRFSSNRNTFSGVTSTTYTTSLDCQRVLRDNQRGVKQLGFRSGNWLTADECSKILKHTNGDTLSAKRHHAMLAMLMGCGLRRSELVALELVDIQMRQGHWAIVDLVGKGGHIRTVPIPSWVKKAIDEWTLSAGITEGRIFRAVGRTGKVWGSGISENVVWYVVKDCCESTGLDHIAPHDLRRTCAKAVSQQRRGAGANSVSIRACICADDRALSRLQAEPAKAGE